MRAQSQGSRRRPTAAWVRALLGALCLWAAVRIVFLVTTSARSGNAAANTPEGARAEWATDAAHVPPLKLSQRVADLHRQWAPVQLRALSEAQRTALVFLYAKGFLECRWTLARKEAFGNLIGHANVFKGHDGAVRTMRRGLVVEPLPDTRVVLRLMASTADTVLSVDDVPPSWHSFDTFTAQVPQWRHPLTSTVFFRDVVPGSGLQRVTMEPSWEWALHPHRRPATFLHAPSVMVYYAQQRMRRARQDAADAADAADAVHRTADLSAFVLRHMPRQMLWRFLEHPHQGVSAEQCLGLLAGVNVSSLRHMYPYEYVAPASGPRKVARLLQTHGLALVTGLKMHAQLFDSHQVSHLGAVHNDTDQGQTSVVVVGYRWDGPVHLILLLQNWWWDKQFLQADLPYLASRDAVLVWLPSVWSPSQVPPSLDWVQGVAVVSAVAGNDAGSFAEELAKDTSC